RTGWENRIAGWEEYTRQKHEPSRPPRSESPAPGPVCADVDRSVRRRGAGGDDRLTLGRAQRDIDLPWAKGPNVTRLVQLRVGKCNADRGDRSRRGQAAGFDSVNTNEILVALWEKFVLMGTNSAVASLTRLPFGKLRDDPEVFALFEKG